MNESWNEGIYMYIRTFGELMKCLRDIFKEKRFWYSIKYCILVIVEKLQGIDFVKNEGHKRLQTSEDTSSVYQATRDTKYLKKVMQQFDITNNDSILDLGCGKGYIMKFFRKYSFSEVAGVELSELLCSIAKSNFDKLKFENCKVYHANAITFDAYRDYNYIYMFNPFPEVVMEKVMEHIYESLEKNNRKIVIIYKGPLCHDIIIRNEVFSLNCVVKGKTLPYNIYCNK